MSGAATNGGGPDALAYVTLTLDGQLCGVPVLGVRDVLDDQRIARIPLAPQDVAGNLNLRGRIVTAIDLRARLRLPPRPQGQRAMSIVIEQGAELYAFLVDQVQEVITLRQSDQEANPPTLSATWRDFSLGVHRLDGNLLVVLDTERLLALDHVAVAA
jgi:purine-binding chemotaxis protein CheW